MISYAICYKGNCKCYYFQSEERFEIDDEVIVDTEKGHQFGKIVKKFENDNNEYKQIIRKASEEDKNNFYRNLKDADIALNKAKSLANDLKLDMHILNAQYNLDRSQLLFNFYADDRIDFRELAKKLASIYRTRIELRQVGARDKAKQIGGIGICGQKMCCSRFLN